MRYNVRCSNRYCQRRRVLSKHPLTYKRPPKCSCGSRLWRIDWFRMKMENARPCSCGSYHFVHARGRGCCIHNPLGAYMAALRYGEVSEKELESLLVAGVNAKLRMLEAEAVTLLEPE